MDDGLPQKREEMRRVREWMMTWLEPLGPEKFTPELDGAMRELWQDRESAMGERRAIVSVFEAILRYQREQSRFTPYYYEQGEKLERLRGEIRERIRERLARYTDEEIQRVQKEVLEILNKIGVAVPSFIEHQDYAAISAMCLPHSREMSCLCRLIAEQFADYDVETVIGPATSGAVLSQLTACHLSEIRGSEVLGVWAKKFRDNSEIFGIGHCGEFVTDRRILVVDFSPVAPTLKLVESARAIGGNVVGLGVFYNCEGVKPQDASSVNPYYFRALVNSNARDGSANPQ